ncbi:hypothetical protein BAY61_04760 [Prauserella marina]|uniref:UPF0182 protein SAMN05421630_11646 n=1 Tax=Prauserella marina TaxID=530584 RepID=A0A222VKF8_9PSEU|nr:UPF0182 family protein [Prauserella marina]ASR34416.1 hypothetical protein BAY61_04760 [Prauserella marina]PWV70970.1 hypothetical protein DES30_11321 [Prauserella marina]SDE00510.1 hypothetical protein SAMN05421630_11646 [Prauserella marina]
MATRPPVSLPKLSRRARILLIIAAAIILMLLLGARFLDTYVDWLWFGEVGARGVFTTILFTRIVLFVATGLLVGGLLAVSLLIAYRTRPVFVPVSGADDPLARYRTVVAARPKLFGIGIPVIAGLIAGFSGQGNWQVVQMFMNSESFGRTDPQFGHDIGFYVFQLPFFGWLLGWLFVAIVVAFVGGLLAHYLFGGVRLAGRGGAISGPARVHLSILIGVFVLFKAAEYFMDRYNLLLSSRNDLFTGATYTDLNAVLPAKLILLCISVFCAIAFFVGAFMRNIQLPAIALVLLILSGVIIGVAWPAVLEQFSVRPNANEKEATSIQRNMDATRFAYGLDNVEYENYSGRSEATGQEIRADEGTIPNIRLLDPNVLSPTFTQRVGRENFYGFPEKLDIDRYEVDGELQSYIVAAKEINTNGLRENQQTWINRHLVYTHGNGFVAAPANTIDRAIEGANSDGGYPLARTSDTQNPNGSGIQVDEPRVYYGELATDYAIVGGQPGQAPGEYDTATDRSYLYQGTGGVPIDNWFNRLVFAAQYGERNILFSDAISEGSKIMYNRDPRERVEKVAPWLTVDGDPYPAVIDGRIKWIVDGYTTLDNYPYAQRTSFGNATEDSLSGVPRQQDNQVNYIRNSVKATVDAFDGNVDLYSMDDNEPVLKAWRSVFPDTVKSESEISPELRQHFRYPEDMFKIQRELLTKYHVRNPQEFFSTQTFWNVPQDPTQEGGLDPNSDAAKQPAYYMLAQAPGQEQPTFQLTSALTPLARQYLAAWVTVSSDPDDYGKINVLRLPTDGSVQLEGPVQVQNAFQSNPKFTQDRTLLGNQSVDIIYGNQLTLPVAGGFLYVEPIYIQQRNAQSYPQLARVLVSYGGKIGFDSTLNGALDDLFGEGTGQAATGPAQDEPAVPDDETDTSTPPPSETNEQSVPPANGGGDNADLEQAVADIQAALTKLKSAQQSGDFDAQGQALAELDAAAQRYQDAEQAGG